MVGRFYGDDIGTEVWAEQKAEGLDDVGTLWFPP